MEVVTIFIWAFVVAIILEVCSLYRKRKKRGQYEKEFERVCNENIMVVDRILHDIEVNKHAEAKLKGLLESAREGEKNEESDISDEC